MVSVPLRLNCRRIIREGVLAAVCLVHTVLLIWSVIINRERSTEYEYAHRDEIWGHWRTVATAYCVDGHGTLVGSSPLAANLQQATSGTTEEDLEARACRLRDW